MKGKEAISAARRRIAVLEEEQRQLSHAHVELQERAKAWQTLADQVPALQARVDRLLAQVKAGSSEKLERFRAESAKRHDNQLDIIKRLARYLQRLADSEDDEAGLTLDEWADACRITQDAGLGDVLPTLSRDNRRAFFPTNVRHTINTINTQQQGAPK